MRPRAIVLLWALAAVLATAAPTRAEAPAEASPPGMRVVYLAGASVYVSAGASEGLRQGDTLRVSRDFRELARLTVSVLSSHRASCDTLFTRLPLRVGDSVTRLRGVPLAPADTGADSLMVAIKPPTGDAVVAAAPARRRRPWLRGRTGLRWMSVQSEGGSRFDQPMLDLRLDGGRDGDPTAASLDLRGRRTSRTAAAGGTDTQQDARVYRASFTLRDRAGHSSVSMGRMSSPSLSPVSLFDGALVERSGERWKAGVFGGTQPEPTRMDWSGDVAEYGGYAEVRSATTARDRHWSAGIGGVSSFDHGQGNRDFLFAQGFWRDRGLSVSLLQEADVMRGWRRAPGEPGFALTSTFASANAQVRPWIAFHGGFDNRRNIRLWRDRLTPETDFDDRYRQGAWVGSSVRTPSGFGFSADQRWSGGAGDPAAVTSAGADWRRPAWRGLAVRGRWSSYRAGEDNSTLLSGSLGTDPVPNLHLELNGGRRETELGTARDAVDWWGVGGDLSMGRRWYLDASFEREQGSAERTSQFYAGVSRRL